MWRYYKLSPIIFCILIYVGLCVYYNMHMLFSRKHIWLNYYIQLTLSLVYFCIWAELRPWFLSLQWRTCPWAEYSDSTYIYRWLRFQDLWSVKKTMKLTFNPCGEFRGSLEGPVSQIHSPHLHAVATRIFSDLLSSGGK